jgi:hypothetical protein
MHPVKGHQLGADDLGEKFDLLLDVLGANREMMNSVGIALMLAVTSSTPRRRFLIQKLHLSIRSRMLMIVKRAFRLVVIPTQAIFCLCHPDTSEAPWKDLDRRLTRILLSPAAPQHALKSMRQAIKSEVP